MLPGKTLHDRFTILKHIGQGSFCDVYLARDETNLKSVAVKVLKEEKSGQKEIASLEALHGVSGVPKLIESGCLSSQTYIVMELMETDLLKIHRQSKMLSTTILLQLAQQTLLALESIHNAGYLHLDIKPDNITVKKRKRGYVCYFVDFGMATRYMLNGAHCPYAEGSEFRGNLIFASRHMLLGARPSRRDDIESLMYTMAYLSNGVLPWRPPECGSFGRIRYEIAEMKENISPQLICGNLPSEFSQILTHVRDLAFPERPDYSLYQSLIMSTAIRLNLDLSDSRVWRRVLITSERRGSAVVPASPQMIPQQKRWKGRSANNVFSGLTVKRSVNRKKTTTRLTKNLLEIDTIPTSTEAGNIDTEPDSTEEDNLGPRQSTRLIEFSGRKNLSRQSTIKSEVIISAELRAHLAVLRNAE